MTIRLTNQLKKSDWEYLDDKNFPFLSKYFFQTLEDSKSIGEGTGWNPLYFTDDKNATFSFIKDQSYGEYIFDWDWANFYHQNKVAYYPKLTSMIPFTSVTTPHFLGGLPDRLMQAYEKFYSEHDFSSSHFLFLPEDELSFFRSYDYIIRDSFQYHFENHSYDNFEDFLGHLKNKKAKQIRKERRFTSDICIRRFTGDNLKDEHAQEMYRFYLSTIRSKNAIAYLTKDFFIKIFNRLKSNIYYVQAKRNGNVIAGSLYFFSTDRLYGRYWGSIEQIPNLHFELCYYQGIEICIKKKLSVFEAGAQGEHKISRGFKPVKTYSAHKFKHPEFSKIIGKYIKNEREHIEQVLEILTKRLPFC